MSVSGIPSGLFLLILIILAFLFSAIKIFNEYERGVVFRLGRLVKGRPLGPGIGIVIPVIDRMVKVGLRLVTMDVPPQDVITKDNVTLKVNAVIYFKVVDPARAVIAVENYYYATQQLSQTTLRSVLGQFDLDGALGKREEINQRLQVILDEQTEPWGVKIVNVELKNMDLPAEMQKAMARQAEAERERRAKVIAAEGEFQAAEKVRQAADELDGSPSALQLRYLQTLVEISGETSTNTVFPIPIDLLKSFAFGDQKPKDLKPNT
jgi:regulator of protease activity HflC (stomatin/prohibitin superfamily)